MRSDLPTGTVTLLFTDVEGSTRLLEELGADAYGARLAEHHRVCREAWAAHGGVEVSTAGDAFFVAFAQPSAALAAAGAAQHALAPVGVAVRMGVHTGEVNVTETGYIGIDVHRAARIAAAGHGGQVLVSAVTAALVGAPLTDLGEHRFKDLGAPERVFQLGQGDFPPLRSLNRSNLPVAATPFLGRGAEVAAVASMLREPEARLVSLIGPGGTGKTRLALQAAAEASDDFPGGVFWAPLAALRDPNLVLAEVATSVGVREGDGGSALDDLAASLAGKRLLVFLDNLEHLLPDGAVRVGELASACPTVTVAVTSRERLALPGERVFAVPPMNDTDALALFRRRASDAGVDLDETGELRMLCTRLDNLPLALELAAARMVLFDPAQLLERLSRRLDLLKAGRGSDARQETLRATIAWSHDLLDPAEQQLFRRLSVFAGGCTYGSAEDVAGADPDTLQSLLDKSLLGRRDSAGGPRFWMLETIREYAAEQLAAAGETGTIQRRHLEYYAALAADCYDETWGMLDDLARLDDESDNLRVAQDLALQTDAETALRLATQLRPSWIGRGEYREGRERLAAAVAEADHLPASQRADALLALAVLSARQGDWEAHDAFSLELLDLTQVLHDPVRRGRTLMIAGWSAYRRGDVERARLLLDEAVELLDTPDGEASRRSALGQIAGLLSNLGDHLGALARQRAIVAKERRDGSEVSLAFYLNNLGWMERAAGETEQARRTLEEAIALARRTGYKPILGNSLHSLGCLLQVSAPADALAALAESLRLGCDMGDPNAVAYCLEGAMPIFAARGDHAHAASLLGASATIRAASGDARSAAEKAEADDVEVQCREALTPEAFAASWEQGAVLDTEAAADWAARRWEQTAEALQTR